MRRSRSSSALCMSAAESLSLPRAALIAISEREIALSSKMFSIFRKGRLPGPTTPSSYSSTMRPVERADSDLPRQGFRMGHGYRVTEWNRFSATNRPPAVVAMTRFTRIIIVSLLQPAVPCFPQKPVCHLKIFFCIAPSMMRMRPIAANCVRGRRLCSVRRRGLRTICHRSLRRHGS
jgi:hypothetical protein